MKARSKPKTPSGKEATLFTYFKPKTPSTSTCVSPNTNGAPNGKQQAAAGTTTPLLDISTNGKHVVTPSRKRKNQEESKTPLTPRLPRAVLCEDDDSDGEIGARKNLSGRPKRRASMTVTERRRVHKRVRRMIDSDSSGEEYKRDSGNEWSNSEDEKVTNDEPVKKSKLMTPLSTPKLSTVSTPSSKTSTPHCAVTPLSVCSPATPSSMENGKMFHETLHWLKDDNRRDKAGCRVNDPHYNPRTLQVPSDFLRKQTPAMKQWWIIKSDNFDTALFFKVGKFYELYHMDAVIGVQELGLVFMKGSFAHSGFPEIAFSRYAQTLVQKGYKVARVEQTETPQMLEERIKNSIKSPSRNDRVVRREVCAHVSKGTRTMGFSEGVELETESSFLLAVKEKSGSGAHSDMIFGVCFVDTCIGTFHLGQFTDDRQCSRLRTLLAHYPPAQILYERGNLSQQVLLLFNKRMASVIKDSLIPGSEFWTSENTLKMLNNERYFDCEEGTGSCDGISHSSKDTWPKVLTEMLSEEHSLGLSPCEDADLAVSALGACLWCLRRSLIDKELLQMKNFERYSPPDVMIDQSALTTDNADLVRQRMVLDDVTLVNLDVLDPNGRCAGTLLDKLDNCSTAFGKRLLKQWLCAPLCSPAAINGRLDAIALLSRNPALVSSVVSVLKALPDLQRLLRRIQTVGSKARTIDHPDSRAILYEETTYSKRKLMDFLSVLDGFTSAMKIPVLFTDIESSSSQLLQVLVTTTDNNGNFPDMSDILQFFNEAFDHKKARKDGIILPHKGVNKQYDQALSDISRIEQQLEDYLNRQRKRLACKGIVYWGSGRNRYQLEVPESALARYIPDEYELKSQRKGFRRYWTTETERLLAEMTDAEERKTDALKDTMRTVFHSFSEHFQKWESIVACLATLDVLIALATYSSGDEMCRPRVTLALPEQFPYVDIRSGRHPCVNLSGEDFIPNDLTINCSQSLRSSSSCVVVTGPNMGGKSTLLRQTGLIVILAQIGCYVPAESCSLTPVDRIFTRLGASDKIMQGESTFYVELSETSVILRHSTRNSLVLLDELGRGTATYDGTAIASAVVNELARVRSCRTLFSTHYHSLVDEFSNDHAFQLGHMACMVENGDEEEEEERITFLYRFVEGACPKSYGFNVARLAGLPQRVVANAREKAREFENNTQRQRLFRLLMSSGKCEDSVRSLHKQLVSISI